MMNESELVQKDKKINKEYFIRVLESLGEENGYEVSFMFVPSGHLLHGCQILVWITYNNITKCIAYTGDIGNPNIKNKYVGSLEKIKNCDILIGESTYGDREKDRKSTRLNSSHL